jgi:uncharacterized protein DUF6406
MSRRQVIVRQGRLAHIDSGAIGGGGCFVDDHGRATVTLAVIPQGTDGEDLDLRQGDTFRLGAEVWEVTEIHQPGTSVWAATVTYVS